MKILPQRKKIWKTGPGAHWSSTNNDRLEHEEASLDKTSYKLSQKNEIHQKHEDTW